MTFRQGANIAIWVFALMLLVNCAPANGRIMAGFIDYHEGGMIVGGDTIPGQNEPAEWVRVALPKEALIPPETRVNGRFPDIWIKLEFKGEQFGAGPLAFSVAKTLSRKAVFLNGTLIYNDIPADGANEFAWNRPELIDLPTQLVVPGHNIVIIRLRESSPKINGAGQIRIGTAGATRSHYLWHYATLFIGPLVINGTLLILTCATMMMWLARRREREFGLLSVVGGLWLFRNLHYFVAVVPYLNAGFWALTMDSLFVLTLALFAFAAEFLKIDNRRTIIVWMSIALGLAALSRYVLLANGISDVFALAVLVPCVWMVVPALYRAWRKSPRPEYLVMLFAIVATNLMSMHDFMIIKLPEAGVGFYLQPYSGLIVYSAFLYALGRRILSAFDTVEGMNTVLQERIEEATNKLAQSETARRTLEVDHAIEQERERMMMEIHDRIGSNLIAAVAVAERRGDPPDTIRTLKNSLTDLRIAVDSLEPIEGDLALVLGNFRHRIEREVLAAGLRFDWHVDEVPPLDWLNATNALHIMRALQEAIGNILAHADATVIGVTCHKSSRGGRTGILVGINDNGVGFSGEPNASGRGIRNMVSRINSLHGEFAIDTRPGAGTSIWMWFPVTRACIYNDGDL